jgi:hypothetical protein
VAELLVDCPLGRQHAQFGAVEAGTHQVIDRFLQRFGAVENADGFADGAILIFGCHLRFLQSDGYMPVFRPTDIEADQRRHGAVGARLRNGGAVIPYRLARSGRDPKSRRISCLRTLRSRFLRVAHRLFALNHSNAPPLSRCSRPACRTLWLRRATWTGEGGN